MNQQEVEIVLWESDWPSIERVLAAAETMSREKRPEHAVNLLRTGIVGAMIARSPAWVKEHYGSLGPTLSRALTAVSRLDEPEGPRAIRQYAVDVLGCEAVGIAVDPPVHAWVASRLGTVSLHRDERDELRWELGFAALAFRVPRLYRTICGLLPGEPAPGFPPPAHHRANIQGWLKTFVGAMEARAPWAEVEPRWRAFVSLWPVSGPSLGLESSTLFFLAYALNVHVRAAPVDSTGEFFRESLAWADAHPSVI